MKPVSQQLRAGCGFPGSKPWWLRQLLVVPAQARHSLGPCGLAGTARLRWRVLRPGPEIEALAGACRLTASLAHGLNKFCAESWLFFGD